MNGTANNAAFASIKATYTDPSSTNMFEQSLGALNQSGADTNSKAAYMNSLRASVKQIQSEVNGFLTTRMEADKAAAISSTGGTAAQRIKARDEEEEENYGEEKVDDQ